MFYAVTAGVVGRHCSVGITENNNQGVRTGRGQAARWAGLTLPQLSDTCCDEAHGEADQVVFGALFSKLLRLLEGKQECLAELTTQRRPRCGEPNESSTQSALTMQTLSRFETRPGTHLSGSVDEQTRVAADAFPPAQVVVVAAVHRSDPDHAVHLLGKVPPLGDSRRRNVSDTFRRSRRRRPPSHETLQGAERGRRGDG